MERLTTSIDQHGRMLIPARIREKLKIALNDKITIEVEQNSIKIINTDSIIDEVHNLFTKNKITAENSIVEDFINQKRQDFLIEENREVKND